MQTIDNGACRPSNCGPGEAAAAQGARGFRGSLQDRADQVVRATVLAELGSNGRHGSGLQGIAAAIRKVLSQSDVAGTEAPDDVLKKIEQSLHEAAQKLADHGVDGKTIDATIDRFRSQLAGALDKLTDGKDAGSQDGTPGTTPGGSSTTAGTSGDTTNPPSTTPPAPSEITSVKQFVAREVRKERGSISLVTAEGDQVAIRFRTKEVVKGTVTETTTADGTKTTATTASVFSRGGIKVEVDGDLNEDELAAIGDLLGKVDEIATKFFSGDVQAAFEAATSLDVSSDQIASYQLDLTYSRRIAAAAWGVARVGSLDPASTGLQPPALPPAGGSTTPATGASANSATPATSAPTATTADAATSTTSGATTGATDSASETPAAGTPPANTSPATPPATAQKTLVDFIGDVLSKLGSAEGAGRLTFSMRWKMNVLMTALETMQPAKPTTPAEESAAKSTQLLGDSLQKTAAA